MTNINVHIAGSSNMGPVSKDFAALQAQVTALNAQLAKMVDVSHQAVDPRGYQKLTKAAAINSDVFRKAAASTGMFDVQQVRLNSATDDYIKKLKAQKMSFRELMRTRKIAHAAFREQLAMENMLVRKSPSGTVSSKETFDVLTPRGYAKELDTVGRRMSFFNEQLKSGANQMVNWGKNTQWAGRQLMVGFTIPLAAFGAAAGVMAYQLDAQMTRVRKVYDTTADSTSGRVEDMIAVQKELAEVTEMSTQTAITAAKEYGQAGTDTLAVQAELAATGKTGLDLQKNTLDVLRIARLGEVEYQVATEATIALQSIFRMSNEELAESFNYMNAVENATSLSTADFAQAIPVAASAVKAWGGDVKELGILLTAMKENGIAASEGANAIKATMQRLARPSKQIREEWEKLTGTNILDITENAESLTDVFTKINDATKDLSDADRRKAFAGLFGSYQVSRMMALTKGMEELGDGVGQVSDAFRIAGQAPETWRQIAENELEQYRNSISGQFKTALEELKLQLATLGEPFVQAATIALKVISKLIDGFNELPDIAKWAIAGSAALAALAGPLVMLTGLFANLIGNGLKMAATMIGVWGRMGTRLNVLDKEGRINAKIQQLQEKGYMSETKAVQNLTLEIQKMTAAQQAANEATALGMANTTGLRKSRALLAQEARAAEQQRLQLAMNQYGVIGTDKRIQYINPETGKQMSHAETESRARADVDRERLMIAQRTTEETQKQDKAAQKMKRSMTGAAIAGGALSAAMVATMVSSNETVQDIANYTMIAAIAAPAAWSLAKGLGVAVAWLAKGKLLTTAIAVQTKVINALWMTGAGMKWSAALGASSSKVGAIARFLPMMVSPMGLLAAGAVAVGAGLFAWHQHIKRAREEQTKMHLSLNNMAEEWAGSLGLVRKEYEKIAAVQETVDEKQKFQKFKDAFQSGEFKEELAAFKDEDLTDAGRLNAAADLYASLQRDWGMSVQDATLAIRALYDTAGYGSIAATDAIDKIVAGFGKIDAMENLDLQAKLFDNLETGTKEWEDAGKDVGLAFAQGISEANTQEESAALVDKFTANINTMWDDVFSEANRGTLGEKFKEVGIDGGNALREAIGQAGSAEDLVDNLFPDLDDWTKDMILSQIADKAAQAQAAEKAFFDGITGEGGLDIDGRINSMYAFQNSVESVGVAMKSLPADRARELFEIAGNPDLDAMNAYMQGLRGLDLALASASDSTKLMAGNAWLASNGFKEVDTYAELAAIAAGDIEPEVDGAKSAIDRATGAAKRLAAAFRLSNDEIADIGREAMGAVQQMVADDYSSAMESAYDADVENTRTYWDNKVEQAGNAGERARDALDKAWERRNAAAEKYWDHRIEMVDKAIEAEQKAEEKREKMFDAEVARIEKLNDLANANIDFNVALNEGKLDEAAKLRNDMQAQADAEIIDRAREQVASKSERRIEKLNKRKDSLEKQRDAAMEAMRREEEAQKASLDRMTEARQAAVEKQRDLEVKAAEERAERQKKQLEEEIELFMAGTATSSAELKKRMTDAGLDYEWFEKHVINKKGLEWGQYFGDKLQSELRKSSEKIRSDAMWENMGSAAIEQMARGMGFSGKRGLMHFLKTGEVKEFTEGKRTTNPGPGINGQNRDPDYGGKTPPARHTGGEVGRGSGSRKGVARTYKGLHPSETLINAQKGEFLVNKKATAENRDTLQAINKGNFKPKQHGKGGDLLGAGMGPYSFFAAAFARGVAQKTSASLKDAVTAKRAEQAAMLAAFASGSPFFGGMGHYSLPGVLPWVLEAANYLGGKFGIGSILGVGSRSSNPTSDHPKGLALDFMTGSAVDKGWALAREALRLQQVLDATYMIFQGRIHSFDQRGWQPYNHPSGATDPTSMHMDHVHISFSSMGHAGDLPKLAGNGAASGPKGVGALWKAAIPGKGWNTSHDYDNNYHDPVFAIGPGVVTQRVFGPTAGSGQHANAWPRGYGSYGVQALLRTDSGVLMTASHLWPGTVRTGRVQGGQQIAQAAATGNASGAHTHFEVNGSTNAQGLFASMGIGLRKGAQYVRFDNTLANLHKGESVMTKDITKKLHQGAELFANGGGVGDTINVYPSEGMNEERLANKVVRKIESKKRRRAVTRTVGKN